MTQERAFLLQTVGRGMYDVSSFKEEAHRLGVQRKIPAFGGIKAGDILMFAYYSQKLRKEPTEHHPLLFGFTILTRLSLHPKIAEAREILNAVVSEFPHQTTKEHVQRRCGWYEIGAVVRADWDEFYKRLWEKWHEMGIKVRIHAAFDFLVGGRFYELEEEVPLPFGIKYSRNTRRLTPHQVELLLEALKPVAAFEAALSSPQEPPAILILAQYAQEALKEPRPHQRTRKQQIKQLAEQVVVPDTVSTTKPAPIPDEVPTPETQPTLMPVASLTEPESSSGERRLCAICGQHPVSDGRLVCEECRERIKARVQAAR